MVRLIRELKDDIVGDRQYWEIGEKCEAIVFIEGSFCSILFRKGNICKTKEYADLLGIVHGVNDIRLNRTIDAYFIECPKDKLQVLLRLIESVL